MGRARRDAARLRRSGGHYDDDKHVIVTGRPALRPLVGLILDTLTCILQALLANRSMGASSLMAGATTSPTRACVHAPVSTLTSHASSRRPSLPPCGRWSIGIEEPTSLLRLPSTPSPRLRRTRPGRARAMPSRAARGPAHATGSSAARGPGSLAVHATGSMAVAAAVASAFARALAAACGAVRGGAPA